MAVAHRPGARDHAVGRHKGIDAPNLFRVNNLHVEADDLRIAMDIFEPGQFPLIGRQTNAAGLMPADILTRNLFQLGIEFIAIGVDFRQIIATGDAWALPRRMPGGA